MATDLPALIRDLHPTLATGTDHAELFDLAVYLHVHITRRWLFRTAEDVSPTMVRRDPLVREAIATLLPGARQDAIGMELRGLAHRAGLPV